jgi:hypothetical protein
MRTTLVLCGIALAVTAALANFNSLMADPPPNGDAEKVKALLQERRDTLAKELELIKKREDIVPDKSVWLEKLTQAALALLEVELELSTSPADRMAAYKKALESCQKLENDFGDRVNRGLALPEDHMRAKDMRLKVQIKMTKEQMKQDAKK